MFEGPATSLSFLVLALPCPSMPISFLPFHCTTCPSFHCFALSFLVLFLLYILFQCPYLTSSLSFRIHFPSLIYVVLVPSCPSSMFLWSITDLLSMSLFFHALSFSVLVLPCPWSSRSCPCTSLSSCFLVLVLLCPCPSSSFAVLHRPSLSLSFQ